MTGSWDKSIRAFDSEVSQIGPYAGPQPIHALKLVLGQTREPIAVTQAAHNDFVKCLHVLPSLKVLVSGGSDKDIRFWDLTSLDAQQSAGGSSASASAVDKVTNAIKSVAVDIGTSASSSVPASASDNKPLRCLATPKSAQTRPIECFASSAITLYDKESDDHSDTGRICLWSADSMGRICTWEVWRDGHRDHRGRGTLRVESRHTWLAHETAIYEIQMSSHEGEAWTGEHFPPNADKMSVLRQSVFLAVSADQLATLWTFDCTNPTSPPVATLRLPHPYYVKSLLALEQLLPGSGMHYVLTGSTDEQIRVWDLSALDASEGAGSANGKSTTRKLLSTAANASEAYRDGKNPAGLVGEIEGHAHEVCKLALWTAPAQEGSAKKEPYVLSAGLDCTIRKWKLRHIVEKAKEKDDGTELTEQERQTKSEIQAGKEERPTQAALTAEEEAELAELMGEDD